jgi:WD40 repeat protein
VSDTQLVAILSHRENEKYKVVCLGLVDDKLMRQWQMDVHGYDARTSGLVDGKHLVIGASGRRTLDVLNVDKKTIEAKYSRLEDGWCRSTVAGSRGEYVVGGDGEDVSVWCRETGTRLGKMSKHGDRVIGAAVHPKKPREFVTYAQDASLIVWRIEDKATNWEEDDNATLVNAPSYPRVTWCRTNDSTCRLLS